MRRSDRLFALIGILRDGRLHKAAGIAASLGVSRRTIYRDMDTLRASGIPVEGERGTGYILKSPITLPPLNLTLTELEALHLGMAVVAEAADEELRTAARALAAKIDTAVPDDRATPPATWGFATSPLADPSRGFTHMPAIRSAIGARQKLQVTAIDTGGRPSTRTVRPLQLDYRGRVWTLTAWCEASRDFRVFRVDRITALTALAELFLDEPGKTLADYATRGHGG